MRHFVTTYKLHLVIAGSILLLGLVVFTIQAFSKPQPLISAQPEAVSVTADDRAVPVIPEDLVLPEPSAPIPSLVDKQQLNVLLLGYGGPGHQGGFLSDVVMVVHLDFAAMKMALIHIPRDLWVHIPVGDKVIDTKINGALAMGTRTNNYPTADLPTDSLLRGSYLTKIAVKQATGLEIDFVIGVDFDDFSNAIDILGGITVDVPQAFEDPWYPVKGRELELCGKTPEEVTSLSATMSGFTLEKQFPCRYEHLQFAKGPQKMDGSTTLKFVRSRHSGTHGGDFARGERQVAALLGIRDQLFSVKSLDNVPKFFALLIKSIKTDLTLDAVASIAPKLIELPSFPVSQIGLNTVNTLQSSTTRNGAYILIPKAGDNVWTDVQGYINKEIAR